MPALALRRRAGELHGREVDRHVEGDVDVVGEQVERDMRHDLDDVLIVEACLAERRDVVGRDLCARLDDFKRR